MTIATAKSGLSFATNRPLRLIALFFLYAAQGAPEGLLYIAVPAWLAENGASPAAIGSYIAIILLPWSLKFINGLLMDRFAFPAMGRRRPWLIGAQLALMATLVTLGLQGPTGDVVLAMTIVGFCVNLAGAFQDVAIDGMAIDIVPPAERARANGVMWGGKTLGIAGGAIVTGWVISQFGLPAAAFVSAGFVAVVILFPLLVRERPGERLLPWTPGEASPQAIHAQDRRWLPLARDLLRALATRLSLVFAIGLFVALAAYGLHTALAPVMAVKRLGWPSQDYSSLAGVANLIGGLFGLALSGFIADRLGPLKALLLALAGLAVLQAGMGLAPGLWSAPMVFQGFIVLHVVLFVLLSVALYAQAMNLSEPRVAATQFSIYMAVLNLGTSFGSHRFGGVLERFDYPGALLVGATACAIAVAIFALMLLKRQRAETAPAAA